MTQIEAARRGEITPQIEQVAKDEFRDPEFVREGVAAGRIAIPANINHRNLHAHGQRQPGHLRRHPGRAAGVGEGRHRREVRRGRHHGPLQFRQDPRLPSPAHREDPAHGGHRSHVRRHRLPRHPARQAHRRRPPERRAGARRGRRRLHDDPRRLQPPRARHLHGDGPPDEHRLARRQPALWLDDDYREGEPLLRALRRPARDLPQVRRDHQPGRRTPRRSPSSSSWESSPSAPGTPVSRWSSRGRATWPSTRSRQT